MNQNGFYLAFRALQLSSFAAGVISVCMDRWDVGAFWMVTAVYYHLLADRQQREAARETGKSEKETWADISLGDKNG